jgi:hypothetical protein
MTPTDADRERDERHSILLTAAETAMTRAQRQQFLDRFPQQRGAQVADILDILLDTDSNVEVIEQIAEQFGSRVPEPGLLAVAVQIANAIDYQALFMRPWETLEPLIERIRPLLTGYTAMELIYVRGKRDALEVLAPLGFVDFEDDECLQAIYHPRLGNMNYSGVRLDNVIELAFDIGHQHGMSDLRNQFRALMGLAGTMHTHPRDDDGR